MRKKEQAMELAQRWAAALPAGDAPTPEEWGATFRLADPECWESWGEEDAECNAIMEFESALGAFAVGGIEIDFPHSTHGDGASSTVYVLPSGVTVIVASATWELECFPLRIYRGEDVDEMIELAQELVWPDYEGEIRNEDESAGYSEEVDVYVSGEAALRTGWSKSRPPA